MILNCRLPIAKNLFVNIEIVKAMHEARLVSVVAITDMKKKKNNNKNKNKKNKKKHIECNKIMLL